MKFKKSLKKKDPSLDLKKLNWSRTIELTLGIVLLKKESSLVWGDRLKLLMRVRLPEMREFDFNDGQYNAMNPLLGKILKNAD